MKKTKITILSVLALSLLVACGGTSSSTPSSATSQTTSETPSSVISGGTSSSPSSIDNTHAVTLGETQGVTLSIDKETAAPGEKVTITVKSIPDGKDIDKIVTDIEGVDVLTTDEIHYTFTMPNVDVTISVILKDEVATTRTLTVTNNANAVYHILDSAQQEVEGVNGVYSLKPLELYYITVGAAYQDTVIIYQQGYKEYPFTSTDGIYTFTMPDNDYAIIIDAKEYRSATLQYDEEDFEFPPTLVVGGNPVENINQILVGVTVYVQATPIEGVNIESINLNGSPIQADAYGNYSFVMPNSNVTVTIVTSGEGETEGYTVNVTDESGSVDVTFGNLQGASQTFVESTSFIAGETKLAIGTSMYFTVEVSGPLAGVYEVDEVTVDGIIITPTTVGTGDNTLEVYPFTITDRDIEVVISTTAATYDLIIDTDTGATGTFTNAEGETITQAQYGEKATITFTNVPEGQSLREIKVNGFSSSSAVYDDNSVTFTIPKGNADNEIIVEPLFASPISLSYVAKCGDVDLTAQTTVLFRVNEVSADPVTTAYAGDTLYVRATAPTGYKITEMSIGNTKLNTSYLYPSYSIPADATSVTLNIVLEELGGNAITVDDTGFPAEYTIEYHYLDDSSGNDATLDPTGVQAGTNVHIDLYALDGTKYINPTAIFANGVACQKDTWCGHYYFIMPDEPVVITATW